MDYKSKYQEWLGFDEETKAELLAIKDEKEIEALDNLLNNVKDNTKRFDKKDIEEKLKEEEERSRKETIKLKKIQMTVSYLHLKFKHKGYL